MVGSPTPTRPVAGTVGITMTARALAATALSIAVRFAAAGVRGRVTTTMRLAAPANSVGS